MKKIRFITVILVLFLIISCKGNKKTDDKVITVYCYDSFLGDWGAGESIAEGFKEKTGISVNFVGCGGASELYSRILYEGANCKADAVVGLCDSININEELFSVIQPYDFGVFAFIWDSESNITPPACLEDLADVEYKDKIIFIDPRTSSVGLGLLKWTIEAFGEAKAFEWWKNTYENALTFASSWSSGYGIFTQGEAPLVISYTTSPVYHLMYEDSDRYKALEFTDGHIETFEYAAVLKNSAKQEEAGLFMDYLLNEGQSTLAVANTMLPVNSQTVLPEEFKSIPDVRIIETDGSFEKKTEEYLDKWTKLFL